MGYRRSKKAMDREEQMQMALLALQNNEYTSINAAGAQFHVTRSTLHRAEDGTKKQVTKRPHGRPRKRKIEETEEPIVREDTEELSGSCNSFLEESIMY
ncbi:hypothetical protein V1507DRAFT_446504 [Lipomyces tetrasporus]